MEWGAESKHLETLLGLILFPCYGAGAGSSPEDPLLMFLLAIYFILQRTTGNLSMRLQGRNQVVQTRITALVLKRQVAKTLALTHEKEGMWVHPTMVDIRG